MSERGREIVNLLDRWTVEPGGATARAASQAVTVVT